jgi:hypothetical protein
MFFPADTAKAYFMADRPINQKALKQAAVEGDIGSAILADVKRSLFSVMRPTSTPEG